MDDDKTTRYVAAFPDLNGDGEVEAVVYLISNGWCGSGGCNTLILARDGDSWRVVTNIPITRPPIRILKEASNGWRSIGVWVQGGGIQPGYEAQLRFDGTTYPRNPTVPPAQRLAGKVEGEVVVPSLAGGTPLYPAVSGSQTRVQDLQPQRPSFDCAKATTPTEKLICADPELAAMDSAMAAAYRDVLQRLPSDQKATLRREHSEWFAEYRRACNSVAFDGERKECVAGYLSAHTADLRSRLP